MVQRPVYVCRETGECLPPPPGRLPQRLVRAVVMPSEPTLVLDADAHPEMGPSVYHRFYDLRYVAFPVSDFVEDKDIPKGHALHVARQDWEEGKLRNA